MRLKSGVTDQYIYFVAVDATDLKSRETGLSSFTVYRSRNGGAASAMTTPTINEVDATNMPGVYELLVDEDTTLDAGDDSQEMVFHITHAGMAPVTRVIEIYRTNVDAVSGDATAADNLEADYDGTGYNKSNSTIGTVTTNTDLVTAAAIADAVWDESTVGHTTAGTFGEQVKTDIDAILVDTGTTIPGDLATIDTNVDAILVDTGTTIPADLATIDANVDAILVDTGTTLDGKINTIDTVVDAILVDTGTTLPATLTTIEGKIDTVDANVDLVLADTGTDGVVISAATANQIADALLNRDMSAVSVTNTRSPINALRFLRNKWSVSGSTLTVTEEDDTTSAWTSTLTSDATADPVVGSDPV